MTDLRASCIHGRYDEHWEWETTPGEDGGHKEPCPGGRDITIDYEPVARKMYERSTVGFPPNWDEADQTFWFYEAALAVDAAIGDTDEPKRKPRIGTSTKRGSR